MQLEQTNTTRKLSLRSFITVTVSIIVTIVLLCSVYFFYIKTARILHEHSRESITNQLNQINSLITEQIETIDSVIPLFISNQLILDALESKTSPESRRFQIERQMSYIYTSTPLSNKNYTDSIYLLCDNSAYFHTYTSGTLEDVSLKCQQLINQIDIAQTKLLCFALPGDSAHIFFARNLFSSNTGSHLGIMAIAADADKLLAYCTKNINPDWFITLYNSDFSLLSDSSQASLQQELMTCLQATAADNPATVQSESVTFQELLLGGESYYIATRNLNKWNIISSVAAPKSPLQQDLDYTLKSYLFLLLVIILVALIAAIIISQAVTKPISIMVKHINEISNGSKNELPPTQLYQEFSLWADAFNDMLKKLDASYNENFQKQLLLKNAEIQALQAQMNPHFVFNILNTIAWKAQMLDNEEIYQMVVSLGELMRMDILSKEHSIITLEQEIAYVKLYIYLQQMRFEDKISCSIQIAPCLLQMQIPCLCIQPLAENAIVHGLEPKKGKGRLIIQALETDEHTLEVTVMDDGVGFRQNSEKTDDTHQADSHTHIGLKNLDKRLRLLFGESAALRIQSSPNTCTSVSFTIPCKTSADSADESERRSCYDFSTAGR